MSLSLSFPSTEQRGVEALWCGSNEIKYINGQCVPSASPGRGVLEKEPWNGARNGAEHTGTLPPHCPPSATGAGGVSPEPCLPSVPWLCFLKKTFSTQHFGLPTELQPLCGDTLIQKTCQGKCCLSCCTFLEKSLDLSVLASPGRWHKIR